MISARTALLAIAAGGAAALAVRMPPVGPFTTAALAVGAGVLLGALSTRRPDPAFVPAGALAGLALVLPVAGWGAGAAFALFAWIPRARRAGSTWDAVAILVLAAAGGAAAPILAGRAASSFALSAAASFLAGVALAAPSLVAEAGRECVALRRAAHGLRAPVASGLRRAASHVERIVRSDGLPALADRARDVADVLVEDARSLGRLSETRGSGALSDERRGDLEARIGRLCQALERAWLTGEIPPTEPRIRVANDLLDEAETAARAHETVLRMGYD